MQIGLLAGLALVAVACTSQGEVTQPTTEPPTEAVAVMPTLEAPTAVNLPSGADLTVDQLPGMPATGEIQTTPSGLRYVVLTEGSGDKPLATSTVKVDYTGYLTDGTKFDSSVDRGEPAEFPLNQVIAGWTEGLQLMSPGATYKLIVPAELGYGESGMPPVIPGGAWLVFDVTLLEIK